jgi:hypothetical protein
MGASSFRDLDTARKWAADDSSTETLLARLYQQWPAVHPELAGNPRTPAHLLARLANSSDPAIASALSRNPTAIASSIRPKVQVPWPAPMSTPPEPAPLGASDARVCPNPACRSLVQSHQVICFSCGQTLRFDLGGAIPTNLAGAGYPYQAVYAPGVDATSLMATTGSIPIVTSHASGSAATPTDAPATTGAAAAKAVVAPPVKHAWRGKFLTVGRAVESRWAKIGAVPVIGLFALLFLVVLGILGYKAFPGGGSSNAAKTSVKPVPKKPTGIPASPSIRTTVVGVSTIGPGGTTSVLAVAAPPAPSTTVATTKAPDAPTTKASAKATTTTVTTAKATTTVAPPSSLVPKSATTATGTESRLQVLAQEYANALASRNLKLVGALNPSHVGDLSGYQNLLASTVIPVSISGAEPSYTVKLGLVAHELSNPSTKRTSLYCAVWKLSLDGHTVIPSSGRLIRTVDGILDPTSLVTEIGQVCK